MAAAIMSGVSMTAVKTWRTHLHFCIKTLEGDAAVDQVLAGNETLLLYDQVPERGQS